MTKQVQLRRGTTAEHAIFTGAEGELTINTTLDIAVVHDGSTVGGRPLVGAAATQTITNKTGVGIGTSSLQDQNELRVIGDVRVKGDINSRSITVRYEDPIQRSGILTGTSSNKITGVGTNNIRVGYAVSGTYIGIGVSVTSIGIGTVFLGIGTNTTYVTNDFSGISTGNFLTSNGTTIIGVNTNIVSVGYGVSGTGVLSNTTVTGISSLNGGSVTISQVSTGTLGITTRTGTSAGLGTDSITSITTTSLALGDYVDYPGSTGIATITSIGANQINVSVGLGTSGSTSFTFSRVVNFAFINLGFTTDFAFVDPYMGQANIDVLNVNNATIQQLNLTQLNGGDLNLNSTNTNVAKINSGIITTAYIDAGNINVGIATTMIVDNNYMNVGIATTMVVTAANLDLAYINVGIGSTVGIQSARLDNAYISVGIGTTVGIQSARLDNAYTSVGLATYFNVTGFATVGNYINGIYDPNSNVTLGVGKPYDVAIIVGTLGTSYSGVGTNFVAGVGTDRITGISTNKIVRSIQATGVATEYSTGTYVSVASTTNGSGTGARFNLTVSSGDITSISVERGGSGYLIGDVIYLNGSATGIGLTPPTLGISSIKVITVTGVSTLGVGNDISGNYVQYGTVISGIETGVVLLSQNTTNTTVSSNQSFVSGPKSTINLDVTGNARVTGILTVGVSSITMDGSTSNITGVNNLRAKEFSASQRVVVDYPTVINYTGTLAYASTTRITGIATANIQVGYAVTNDYLLPGTSVAAIGNSSVTITGFAQNIAPTQTTSGYIESVNGNKIAGVNTSNIFVGSAATGTYIPNGTTVSSIGIGSITLSANTTSPIGEKVYQGTLSATGVSTITGIATSGIVAGENVYAANYILPGTTVVSVGSSSITLSQPPSQVGVVTQTYAFRKLDTYQFVYAAGAVVTDTFYFEDAYSGISTIPNLRGRNLLFTGIGSFDTVIADTTIITSGLIVENINVPGVGTIGVLKSQLGIITDLSGTNISYSGLGSIGNVKIGYGNTDFLVTGNARITGVLTVGQGSVTISGNNNEIVGASNLNSQSGIVTFLEGSNLNYTGVSTLNQVGVSTLTFVGVNTATSLDKSVQFKLSNTGIATNYTLTLPPDPGKDGMVLTVDTYGNLGFATAGLYENRIYVSSANGSDEYDGKTRPVATIKKAAQLASFESFVLPAGRFLDAGDLLTKNKTFIQEEVVGFITATYPGITTNPDWDRTICRRDVGYIVDAVAYDLSYGGNSQAVGAGVSYWLGVGGTSFVEGETIETVDAFNHIVDISKYIINNIAIPDPGGRYDDASRLLTLNKEYIKAEAVGYVTAIYPGLLSNPTYSRTKCLRDTGYIVDAIAYDLKYGGNMKSVGAGVSYWSGLGTSYVTGEQVETSAAFRYIAGISSYIINNVTVPQSYQVGVGSTAQVKDLTIAYDASCGAGTSYGFLCCSDVRSTINNLVGIITSIVGQGVSVAPSITRPVGLYQTTTSQTFDYTIIFDELANPVGYASTGCANVQSSIANLVGIITTIIGIGTTAAPTVVIPTSKSNPVAIIVEAGEYFEDNPIILYEDVAVIGDNLRNTIIRPLNAGKDLLRVRNGCYLTGFAMKDYVDAAGVPQYTFDYACAFDDPFDPFVDRTGYAVKNTKPIITRSPYIQNASILSFLGGNGMLVDGSKITTPNTSIIPEESETPVLGAQPEFGKSMVANAFTMVSFGGIGWRVINDGYSQVVSCFQIFCRYGSLAQSGGYLSITNSATNFGYYALRSTGFSANSFAFDRGRIAATGTSGGYQTLVVVGAGRSEQDLYVARFFDDTFVDRTNLFKPLVVTEEFNATTDVDINLDTFNIVGHPFSQGDSVVYFGDEGVIPARVIGGLVNQNQYYVQYVDSNSFKLYEDNSFTKLANVTSTTTGINTFTKNNQEFFVKEIIPSGTHNQYQAVGLASTSSTLRFVSGRQISQTVTGGTAVGFALTYNSSTRTVIVSVESISGVRRNFAVTGGPAGDISDHSPVPVSIAATSVTGISTYWTINFKVDSTVAGTPVIGISSLPETYRLHFHRPSIVNSSSHTWEFSGSGIDYNALPQNGGRSVTSSQQVSELGGRVYTSGTNELGDFLIGDFITAYNRTGNIIFNNTVTIGTLDSIRLSLSGGIQIEEFSGDVGLGDNEIGGPLNKRVSTQLAVRSFLSNRLGSFIDKTVSTNAVPSAVVQLNSIGQINADLIPPKVVNYLRTIYPGGKTSLANRIPAANIQSGDTVVEPINAYVLISDVLSQYIILSDSGSYNFLNGDTVYGTVSQGGAIGLVTAPPYTTGGAIGYGTTGLVKGVGLTLNTLTGGSGYSVAGIYSGVQALRTTGIGTGMSLNVTVSAAGTVSAVAIETGGKGYGIGDYVTVAPANVGGRSGGTDFTIRIGSVETRLYLSLTNNQKFLGSTALPDYISDRNAVAISTNVGIATTATFTGTGIDVGGNVDFTNDRIVVGVSNTIFTDGDHVRYYSTGNVVQPLILLETYYVKRVGLTSVELYDSYALSNKVNLTDSGTGSHSLTRLGINTATDQITFVNHGFSQGDPVRVTVPNGNVAPIGITTGGFYFIGSRTTNTFTLHLTRSDALLSANGLLYNTVDITGVGTAGIVSFTKQNITYTSTINTSSTNENNWALLATSTIDGGNIVSGTVSPSRLGSGSANSQTFLRGDSSYQKVVTSVGIGTTQPIGVTATSTDFAAGGVGINTYYGNVRLTLNRVYPSLDLYSTLGIAAFKNSTFGISTTGSGEVYIKTTSQGGDVDAATFNGNAASYYLDINNIQGNIPITRGGTGLQALPASGAILIGNGSSYNLTATPTFTGTITFAGISNAISMPANSDITFTTGGTWTGEKAAKVQYYNNVLYLQYTTGLNLRNSAGTDRFTINAAGNTVVGGTLQGTQLISTIATGTSPLSVTSTTRVDNLNAQYLSGLALNTSGRANNANEVVRTDSNGYLQTGWINTTSGDLGVANLLDRVYCSNDGYIRYLGLTDFKEQIGLSAKNSYHRRASTTDSNYFTGSLGWSNTASAGANETFHGGSAFFDIWNGTNFPSTFTHIHGVQMVHYTTNSFGTTGGTAYGWQLATQYDTDAGPFWRRCNAGTFSAWRKIWHDTNDGAGSGLDADLLDGYSSSQSNTANTVAVRDSSGGITNSYYSSPYSGSNSSLTRSSYAYTFGFQESGAWTNPYPDLVLQYHTGVTLAANPGYEGITFKNDYNDDTVRFRVNGGSSYTYKYTWMYTPGSNGFYSDQNSWEIQPNLSSSYGSECLRGSRNGWRGIHFEGGGNTPHVMFDGSANGGFYYESTGRWSLYYAHSNACWGVNTSSTSSSYAIYTSGNIYATGTITAASDARKKTEIETVTNALDKVNQLRGVTYKRTDIKEDDSRYNKVEIGVIAQEVEAVLPEVVTYASDVDEYAVSYGNFAGLFIEAIKEQNAIINTLKKEIEDLKSKLGE
jgi:hypothetical protein